METDPRIAYAVRHLPNASLAPVPRPRPSRQRVDIVRHQVEEGPQQAVRCDAAERAHAEPAIYPCEAGDEGFGVGGVGTWQKEADESA